MSGDADLRLLDMSQIDIWICWIPCLPLHVTAAWPNEIAALALQIRHPRQP